MVHVHVLQQGIPNEAPSPAAAGNATSETFLLLGKTLSGLGKLQTTVVLRGFCNFFLVRYIARKTVVPNVVSILFYRKQSSYTLLNYY